MTMATRKTTQLIRLKFGRLRFEIYGVHGHRELIPCCGFGYYPFANQVALDEIESTNVEVTREPLRLTWSLRENEMMI